MNKPHKHAAVIKAWADGKAIQFGHLPAPTAQDPLARREVYWNDFYLGDSFSPAFCAPQLLWRVKPEPLEWQVERDAFARGEKIEVRWSERLGKSPWIETPIPSWLPAPAGYEYRVKPKPHKWQKECEAFERGERIQWRSTSPQHAGMAWRDVPDKSPLMGPAFSEPTNEFRIPHKWQAEMDAHSRGEMIQYRDSDPAFYLAYGFQDWTDFNINTDPNPKWRTHATREYRIKPKTVKTRIRVAAMGLADGSGTAWTRSVYTDDLAAQTERRADFLCWLHNWKEIERPVAPIADSDVARAFQRAFSAGSVTSEQGWLSVSTITSVSASNPEMKGDFA